MYCMELLKYYITMGYGRHEWTLKAMCSVWKGRIFSFCIVSGLVLFTTDLVTLLQTRKLLLEQKMNV